MIGYLSGKIHSVSDTHLILDVNGVGYEIHPPKSTLLRFTGNGGAASFEIHTHMTENALSLYGFATAKEKQVFQKLISVSGIGPKLGLTIISDLPLNQLFTAVTQGRIDELTKISGIGKKTAERIVIELRDKFKDEVVLERSTAANDNPTHDARLNDVTSALMSLGYPEFHARRVVNGLTVEATDSVQTLIKKSLSGLQKN